MESSLKENRLATSPDYRKVEGWKRYLYNVHLAAQENEKIECRHAVFPSETIESQEATEKKP